jgi:hypothetical protein
MTRWIFPVSLVTAIVVGEYVRYRLTGYAAKLDEMLNEYDPDRHILPATMTRRPADGQVRDGLSAAGGDAASSPADPSTTATETNP